MKKRDDMPTGIYQHKKGWKHKEETKVKIGKSNSIALKGRKNGPLSEETKRKIGLANSIILKGKFSGEKSSNWKGGITPLTKIIRHCFRYRQWVSDIFTRDDFTCQICGKRSGNGKMVYLEADHYPKMFSQIFQENKIQSLENAIECEELWNINNGRTLCRECHNPTRGKRFNI